MKIETKTFPLSTTDIISFFENPDHFFYIDYNGSALKKESFLTYIANMKMKCDLIDYASISFEDREEMLFAFMHYNYIVEVPALKNALASLLMYSRSGEMIFDFFSKEEADQFIEKHKTKIQEASCFFDSMLFVMPSMSHEFKEQVFNKAIEEGQVEVVEDAEAIGINTFSLIAMPDFVDIFIGLNKEELKIKYYKHAIEKFTYKNKKLFQLVTDLETPSFLMSLFNLFSSKEDLESEYFEKLKGA